MSAEIPKPCISLPVLWESRDQILSAALPRHSVGLELGVQTGAFSELTLKLLRPDRLVLVDAWRPGIYRAGEIELRSDNATHHTKCRSMTLHMIENAFSKGIVKTLHYFEDGISEPPPDFYKSNKSDKCVDVFRYLTEAAAHYFPFNYFDWIYVDAHHTYEASLDDFRRYAGKLKPGGHLMAHDFNPIGQVRVDKAVRTFLNERPDFEAIGVSGESRAPTVVLQRH